MKTQDIQLQSSIGQVQSDILKLNKYFKSSLGYLAEVVANTSTTSTTMLTPIKTLLSALKTVADKAENATPHYTVTEGINFINFETIETFQEAVDLLIAKWTARLASMPDFSDAANSEKAKDWENTIAELYSDLDSFFFNDAKLFRSFLYYVESIKLSSDITDEDAFIAPFVTFIDAWITIIADYKGNDDTAVWPIKVQSAGIDFINPFVLAEAKVVVEGVIKEEVKRAIAIRDAGSTPAIPAPTVVAGSVTSTSDGGTYTLTVDLKGQTASVKTNVITTSGAGVVAPTTLVDGANACTVSGLVSGEDATVTYTVTTPGGTATGTVNIPAVA